VDQPAADHVWIDNVAACREMTRLLIGEGHRRIAVLGVMESESSRLRLLGYRQAMAEAGLPPDPELTIRTTDWTPAGGAAAMRSYLDAHPLPDAVFSFTDSMAMGALNVLWEAGHRVPQDLSVVGYDDVSDAEFAIPPLTTVGFDRRHLVDTALNLLTERILDNDRSTISTIIPYSLIRRNSTRARS
jgi:LacI family repressor for deo operon, udp, cdd, tsx, nupC, and nupG